MLQFNINSYNVMYHEHSCIPPVCHFLGATARILFDAGFPQPRLLGSAGRLGFVVLFCRSPLVRPGWRCLSRYVSGEGAYREMFSSARSTFWRAQNLPRQGFLQKRTHRATLLKQESQVWSEAGNSAPGEYKKARI